MAEETGNKDDPTAEAATKGAGSSRAGASRKTRSTKRKGTTSAGKTAGVSRTSTGKASRATTARRKARRPAATKKASATASTAAEKTTDERVASDRGTAASAGAATAPRAGDAETVTRGRDEFWRALAIIGFGAVSVGLVGLAALGGLAQSVMRVSRPRETPPLRGFQKGVAAYLRQIVDYLAAPDAAATLPFPFSDFPDDAPSADNGHDGKAEK